MGWAVGNPCLVKDTGEAPDPSSVEMTDIQRAALALVILSAIPVVTLALWSQYYLADYERRRLEDTELDPASELSKIRTVGMCAMFFQFALYLGASEVRAAYSWLTPVGCGLAFMAQAWIQASLERRVRVKPAATPGAQLKLALRFLSVIFVAGGFYMGALLACILGASVISALLHLSGPAQTVVVMVGGMFGLAAGIGLNFGLGAFHVRRLFPVTALQDTFLKERFASCFARAHLPAPHIWVIELERFRFASALVAGFRGGRGLFAPGLFISRTTLNQLSDAELEAVVLHEVSHLSLNHLRNRLLFSSGLVIATTIAGTFFVLLGQLLMPYDSSTWILGPAMGFFAFIMTFKLLGDQSQFHELEADIHSIEKLGGHLPELAAALRKLDRINRRSSATTAASTEGSPLMPAGHPETERRILMIRHYLATKAKIAAAAATQQKRSNEHKKDAA